MSRSTATQLRSALVLCAVLAACSSSSGPEYADIGVAAADASGVELGNQCVPLPLLPGGAVEQDLDLAPSLTAHVLAKRDSAEVTLHGASDPPSVDVTVPLTTLLDGYENPIVVTTADGTRYLVVLVSPCTPGMSVRLDQ